jgi:hypothetical protein
VKQELCAAFVSRNVCLMVFLTQNLHLSLMKCGLQGVDIKVCTADSGSLIVTLFMKVNIFFI